MFHPQPVCVCSCHIPCEQVNATPKLISHAFIGVSFATFICIILYHIYLSLSKTLVWQKLPNTRSRVGEKVIKMCKLGQEDRNRQLINEQPQDLCGKVNAPTTSTVELCEPLLLDTDTHSYQ